MLSSSLALILTDSCGMGGKLHFVIRSGMEQESLWSRQETGSIYIWGRDVCEYFLDIAQLKTSLFFGVRSEVYRC